MTSKRITRLPPTILTLSPLPRFKDNYLEQFVSLWFSRHTSTAEPILYTNKINLLRGKLLLLTELPCYFAMEPSVLFQQYISLNGRAYACKNFFLYRTRDNVKDSLQQDNDKLKVLYWKYKFLSYRFRFLFAYPTKKMMRGFRVRIGAGI